MSFSRGAWGARQPTLHLGVVVLTAGERGDVLARLSKGQFFLVG